MRTNNFFSIAFIVAAVMMTSCRKEETPVKPAPEGGITFAASIGSPYTKTTLTDDNKVWWSDGDCISINGVRFVGTPKTDPATADFVKAEAKELPAGKYHAFFPADIQVAGQYGRFPGVQRFSEGRFDNVPMYACSENTSLEFKNICGVLAVSVPSGEIDRVTSIRVSSTDEAMSGEFEVVGDTVGVLTEAARDSVCSVILYCDAPVSIDADTVVFHIAIPAQKYSDINIEISSDGHTYTKGMLTKAKDSIDVRSSTISPVVFKADAPTANCYISSRDSVYTIKAVKGCGSELVGRVKSVKVLWESFGTATPPSENALIDSIGYSRGFITYRTIDTTGNAVIAACDGENGTGKILWSWHIWLTDRPKEQKYYNNAGILMDRYLGATSADSGDVGALGLLYQWGRKDPFLGSSSINSSQTAASFGSLEQNHQSPVALDYTIAHPTSFVTLGPGGSGLWTLDPRAYWDREKTMFDPCPVGWRVSDGGPSGVWNVASASRTVPVFDDSHKGYDCKGYFTSSEEGCWYPAAGYRGDNAEIAKVGEKGKCWSCTEVPFVPIMLFGLGFDKNEFDMGLCDYPVKGMSVRCQKMEEE